MREIGSKDALEAGYKTLLNDRRSGMTMQQAVDNLGDTKETALAEFARVGATGNLNGNPMKECLVADYFTRCGLTVSHVGMFTACTVDADGKWVEMRLPAHVAATIIDWCNEALK